MVSKSTLVWFCMATMSLLTKETNCSTLIYVKPKFTWGEAWKNCRNKYNGTLAWVHRKKTFMKKLAGCVETNDELWFGKFSQVSAWVSVEGCFFDFSVHLNQSLNGMYTSRPSVMECQSLCGSKPSDKFAIQGYFCVCGVDTKNMMRIKNDDCDRQCDRRAFCGGKGFYSVYKNIDIFKRPTSRNKMCVAVRCKQKGHNEYRLSYKSRKCDANYKYICNETRKNGERGKWSLANKCRLFKHRKYSADKNTEKPCYNLSKNTTYWTRIFRSERFIHDKEYRGELVDPVRVMTMSLSDGSMLEKEYIWNNSMRLSSLCETENVAGLVSEEDIICKYQYKTSEKKYDYDDDDDEDDDDDDNGVSNEKNVKSIDNDLYKNNNNSNIDDDDDDNGDSNEKNEKSVDDDLYKNNNNSNILNIDDDDDDDDGGGGGGGDGGDDDNDGYIDDDYDDIDNGTLDIVNSEDKITDMKTFNDNVISTQYTLISASETSAEPTNHSFRSDNFIVYITLATASSAFILLVISLFFRRARRKVQIEEQMSMQQHTQTVTNHAYEGNELLSEIIPPYFDRKPFEATKNNHYNTDHSDTKRDHKFAPDSPMSGGLGKDSELMPSTSKDDVDNHLYCTIDNVVCDDCSVDDDDRQGLATRRIVSGEYNVPCDDNYFVLEKVFNTNKNISVSEVIDKLSTSESDPDTSKDYFILEPRSLPGHSFEFIEDQDSYVFKEIEDEMFRECDENEYDHLHSIRTRLLSSQTENVYDHLPSSPELDVFLPP